MEVGKVARDGEHRGLLLFCGNSIKTKPCKASASQRFKGCVKLKVLEGKGIKVAPNSALTCSREG